MDIIWIHLFVEYKNKAKQNEQSNSRLIDTEKWLVVPKGEGLGRVGSEGEGDQGEQIFFIVT